jgi:hypothetical protein
MPTQWTRTVIAGLSLSEWTIVTATQVRSIENAFGPLVTGVAGSSDLAYTNAAVLAADSGARQLGPAAGRGAMGSEVVVLVPPVPDVVAGCHALRPGRPVATPAIVGGVACGCAAGALEVRVGSAA